MVTLHVMLVAHALVVNSGCHSRTDVRKNAVVTIGCSEVCLGCHIEVGVGSNHVPQ